MHMYIKQEYDLKKGRKVNYIFTLLYSYYIFVLITLFIIVIITHFCITLIRVKLKNV